jgi:hypothetical protein
MFEKKQLQDALSEHKSLPLSSAEEIQYAMTPIGKAIYTSGPSDPNRFKERIICKICGKLFTRSNTSRHNRTQYHQLYLNMHNKMRKILLD